MATQTIVHANAGKKLGSGKQPGFFLTDDENCVRISHTFGDSDADLDKISGFDPVMTDDGVLIPAGAIVSTIQGETKVPLGFVYEDVWIPKQGDGIVGTAAGSLVVRGTIDLNKVPMYVEVAELLSQLGFEFVSTGDVTRPY